MNNELTVIETTYSKLSDKKLESIVTDDLFGLTDAGLIALRNEVFKRGLPLIKEIEERLIERERLIKLIDQKCEELRNLPCPMCGSEEYKLNAINLKTVVSFITVTKVTTEFHFGCYNCLQEKKQVAEDKTSLLGWWGIFGFLETKKALRENDDTMKQINDGEITDSLRKYAQNILHH